MNVPDYIPMLVRGASPSPEQGGCLVQIANWLADPSLWSYQPVHVHPRLAQIAITVNDQVNDETRHMLAPLAARLTGTNIIDPKVDMGLLIWMSTHKPYTFSQKWRPRRGGAVEVTLSISFLQGEEVVQYLTDLLDEFDRLTGRTADEVPVEKWLELKELVGQ